MSRPRLSVALSLSLLISLSGGSIVASALDSETANKLIVSTGKARVQLLELYSSEGCSSCPPADQWVSELRSQAKLWKNFVPVVFHVDYWNYLGWKDAFSSDTMTQRQIHVAHQWSVPRVYTPAIVVDGREWRAWSGVQNHQLPEIDKPSGIVLSVFRNSQGEFSVKVEGQTAQKNYSVHLAMLGMDISSKVTEGENSGKDLRHNFVILDWQTRDLAGLNSQVKFSKPSLNQKVAKMAIAVWIEELGRPQPLQAAGAYL